MAGNQNLKARDIMHHPVQCVGEHQTLQDAARMMRELDVGAVPICGDDNKLKGMITDRDIVTKCCAEGRDVSGVTAGELRGEVRWIDAGADVRDVLDVMEQYQIKRLPVIDENRQLVGLISESDLARNVSDDQLAEFVSKVFIPHRSSSSPA
ncbi:CBS domain-containing protein [Streptomyces orinoci]|uniref:CBS domain-containing protein n=1 Tax=Streptomyces orinoci TaxID=67339 RepID=A0ABV3JR24_STRON|nr:CBS domain-containing protein [Streptomyces orinoci]